MNTEIEKLVDPGMRHPAAVEDAVEVEVPARSPFELWATIKKSSKYYGQNKTDKAGKALPFQIYAVLMHGADSYDFKGGPGGSYRREDLQLFVKCNGKFKRI